MSVASALKGALQHRVFSGIQPTGIVHLGNYCGAMKNWVALQRENPGNVLYCVVDLHALTAPFALESLKQSSRLTAACIIAAGVDTKSAILFKQSDVREHSELCWLLSCVTPLGNLSRMTQFKAKKSQERDGVPLALLSYPVLQAADILLYKATEVPVGEDQHQHLELARDIAAAFNRRYCAGDASGFFPLPSTISPPEAARIMSLRDGGRKMSKSDADDGSRINITDSADVIRAKVRKAKTDSNAGFTFDPIARPEKSNLLTIYASMTDESIDSLCARHASTSALDFKNELADVIISRVVPMGGEVNRLLQHPMELDNVLQNGADRARSIAADTMAGVRSLVGL